jgi:iron complex transport system ATP-binding protein
MLILDKLQIGHDTSLFSADKITLKSGKLITLIGKNGSGKSTFFFTLLNQIKPIDGEIRLENNLLSNFSKKELSKKITFVASKFDGVQHLKVSDYLKLGRMPYTNFLGKISKLDQEKINKMVDLLDITYLLDKDTTKISDGERQICSIAKALVQETDIVLLDEPTAFLDYANKIKVLKILSKISKELNICILQSTHDLDLSLDYSDEYLIIAKNSSQLQHKFGEDLKKNEIIQLAFEI